MISTLRYLKTHYLIYCILKFEYKHPWSPIRDFSTEAPGGNSPSGIVGFGVGLGGLKTPEFLKNC